MVGSEISFIPHAVTHERKQRGIDESFKLLDAYVEVISQPWFWTKVETAHSIIDYICKCIGICEFDQSTMSTAYSCDISIHFHIKENNILSIA